MGIETQSRTFCRQVTGSLQQSFRDDWFALRVQFQGWNLLVGETWVDWWLFGRLVVLRSNPLGWVCRPKSWILGNRCGLLGA